MEILSPQEIQDSTLIPSPIKAPTPAITIIPPPSFPCIEPSENNFKPIIFKAFLYKKAPVEINFAEAKILA